MYSVRDRSRTVACRNHSAAPLFGKAAFGFDNGWFCAEAFIQFQAECNLRADKKHVKEIERVMTLILGRRSEMSTFNVSTADAVDVLD
jgi:hypothetical protein